MFPARFQEDLAQMGGAVVGGMGAEYLKQSVAAIKANEINSLLADLGIAAVGIFGASQIGGTFASLAEGIALGALGHAGITIGKQAGFLPSYKAAYSPYVQTYYPDYSSGYSYAGISPALEI